MKITLNVTVEQTPTGGFIVTDSQGDAIMTMSDIVGTGKTPKDAAIAAAKWVREQVEKRLNDSK